MAIRATITAIALVLLGTLGSVAADSRHTILIVFDEDRDLPGLSVINQSLRDTFRAKLRGDVEFLSESLNLSQFKGPAYDATERDYFLRKYANKRPDLIVAVMEPALEFLLRDHQLLFPGVPIVFCGVDASDPDLNRLPANVTGVVVKRNWAPTVDIALRLQPDTKNIYVIGGTSDFDRRMQTIAQSNLAPYEKRVRIRYLTDLPMPQLVATVAKLPPQSGIVYLTLFRDGAGRAFVPHDALSQITRAASAPVFVALDQYLDLGVVGGRVYSTANTGRQAADMGVQILNGQQPPLIEQSAYADIFDWRQLKRWGFDETRVPPGSEIRHRQLTAWELYKSYIAAGIAIFILQTALIVALLVNHAQRRRAEARTIQAEAEVQRQRDELAHALRLTTLGELTASIAHEIRQPLTGILTNANAVNRLVTSRSMTAEEMNEALRDIEEDTTRIADTIHRIRELARKEQGHRVSVDMNCIVDDVLRLLSLDIRRKKIGVEFHRAEGTNVTGDPVQLRQVLMNLLVNAAEAIDGDRDGRRRIQIETNRRNGMVSIAVRDTGRGANDAELQRMFERFVTTKPDGLGMGLAISQTIVEAHHGRIWATRNEDRGLSLHVELPAARVDVREAQAQTESVMRS
jgi:signal transduction histidine kinase